MDFLTIDSWVNLKKRYGKTAYTQVILLPPLQNYFNENSELEYCLKRSVYENGDIHKKMLIKNDEIC